MNPVSNARNPWPLAIVTVFIVFATFIAIFTAWAMHQREDLVAVNYYENEVRYQSQLDRLNQTRPLAAQVAVSYDPAQRSIVITLPVAQAREAVGHIHLYRPSDARLDRDLPLAVSPEGIQRFDARELRAGLWKVRVQWSANGKDFFFDQSVMVSPAQT